MSELIPIEQPLDPASELAAIHEELAALLKQKSGLEARELALKRRKTKLLAEEQPAKALATEVRPQRASGTVYFKRSNMRWAASVTVGKGANGRRKRATIYATTREEAIQRLEELRSTFPSEKRRNAASLAVEFLSDTSGDLVYFAKQAYAKMVKIGVSKRPSFRLKGMQTSTGTKLILLGSVPGGYPLEAHLHKMLESERVAGEWFKLSKRVSETIEGLLAAARTAGL
jgi:hypothetical protein